MTTHYVSQSTANGYAVGADTNNGTSKATPFLTVGKALSVWVSNDSIVVNDGVYTATDGGFGAYYNVNRGGGSFAPETYRGATLKGVAGQTRVANIALPAAATLLIGAFVIDASMLTSNGSYAVDTASNASTYIYQGTDFIGANTGTSTGCARGNSSTATYQYLGCRVRGNCATFGLNHSAITTGPLIVDGLEVNLPSLSASIGGAIYAQGTAAGASVYVNNVYGTATLNTSNMGGLTFYNIANLLLKGPCGAGGYCGPGDKEFTVTGTGTGSSAGIKVLANATITMPNIMIDGFNMITSLNSGYAVLIGNDASGGASSDGMIVDAVVNNCHFKNPTPSNQMHGVITAWQTGGIHSNNRIDGYYISTIHKNMLVHRGRSYGNECYNGTNAGSAAHLYSKGNSMGASFMCNKIYMTSGNMMRAFESGWNDTSTQVDSGSIFMGNIVYANATVSQMAVVGGTGDATVTPTFLFNDYSIPGVSGNPWQVGATPTNYATLSAWAAAVEPTAQSVLPNVMAPSFFRRTVRLLAREILGFDLSQTSGL